ncbi:MAG: hypothetical protein QXU69_09430 [Thermofilaceae archaeon]
MRKDPTPGNTDTKLHQQVERQAEVFNINAALDFLERLWSYVSPDARWVAIVRIGKRVRYGFVEAADPETMRKQILAAVESIKKTLEPGESVYFQVLPLYRRPERGRGTAADVKVGKWLWADIDYKREVTEGTPFIKEGEDYSLEAIYEEGGKLIRVDRPPLKLVLKEVEEATGLVPSLVVDSGCGYHFYFLLTQEIEAKRLQRLEAWLIDTLQKSGINVDTKSKDLARILRLPGFVNPRVNRLVRVIWTFPAAVDPDQLEKRIAEEEKHVEAATPFTAAAQIPQRGRPLRELSDAEILKIVELLKEAYKPGYRQFIALYLSGWLAKARVSPISAVKILKILYESTQDGDPLKTRLSAVIYSYKKAGIDVDAYTSEIERLTGVRPYGLESEMDEVAVKGKSGLQEILEATIGEEKAVEVIHQLSEVLQTLSPWKDMVVFLFDEGRQIYYVADPRRLVIRRAVRKEKMIGREVVVTAVPVRVVEYRNPIGGVRKYEVTFEARRANGEREAFTIGPAYLEEIADRLKAEGFVSCQRLLYDALSAIIRAFIMKGKAEERVEIEAPGFYLIEGKLVSVKFDANYNRDRLREALELLNELADVWFAHARERFATVVKWGAVAPFSFILKQLKQRGEGRWLPWLYMYGPSNTGKTTLGKIVLKMWGLDSMCEKSGGNIDTVPRLGAVLSICTLPIMVNEPGGALEKEDVVEAIKNAVENPVCRGKYVKGTYVEYPALAPILFTSNMYVPRDDALMRRLILIDFTIGERIPPERVKEFEEKVEPRLQVLGEIGKCIAKQVEEDPSILKGEPLKIGENLLAMCYTEAGLPIPDWLGLTYENYEDYREVIVEEFIERLKGLVNDTYARYERVVRNITGQEGGTVSERLQHLLRIDALPGMKQKGECVIITGGLLEALKMNITLKSLAEIIGGEYKNYKNGNNVRKVIEIPLSQLISLFL